VQDITSLNLRCGLLAVLALVTSLASADTLELKNGGQIKGKFLGGTETEVSGNGVLVELADRASGVPVPNWAFPPREACAVPIRLGEHSETPGFLVAGIHPGRAFDDAYRQFVYRIAEQITIGLTSARAYEQERQPRLDNAVMP